VITSSLIGFGIALGAVWVALGAAVFALRPPGHSIAGILRVLPDSLRLAAALYRDRALPGSVRRRLRIALISNIQPINLCSGADLRGGSGTASGSAGNMPEAEATV